VGATLPNAQLPQFHQLSDDTLRQLLAGRGNADAIRSLEASEYSWRLLSLRAVRDLISEHGPDVTGPLSPLDEVFDVIDRAEREVPSAVRDILSFPTVGAWANNLLHRLQTEAMRHDERLADDSTPLWVDIGYLHSIAVTCAAKAGIDFTLDIPVWQRFTILPTLGTIRFGDHVAAQVATVRGSHESITASCHDGQLVLAHTNGSWNAVSTTDNVSWWEIRSISSVASCGSTIKLIMDDVDPYRRYSSMELPQRMPDVELQEWQTLLDDAWELLIAHDSDRAMALACGMISIVPEPAAQRFHPFSASSGDAFGSAIMSIPDDATLLALTLVHEFSHVELGALMHLYPDAEEKLRTGVQHYVHAPWRDDPRPLAGMLQGVYAFVAVTRFWRRHRELASGPEVGLAHFEFALWRRGTREAICELHQRPEFTDLGRLVLDELIAETASWNHEVVPEPFLHLANRAHVDHRATWRAHHIHPRVETVSELTDSWMQRRTSPELEAATNDEVATSSEVLRLDTRATVVRLLLTDPAAFKRLQANPDTDNTDVPGATAGDLALVADQFDAARERYLDELAKYGPRPSSLIGLGLSLSSRSNEGSILLARPEIARSLLLELARVRVEGSELRSFPQAVAAWLDDDDH
jgi:HEXXH motif-containing protein